MTILEKILAVWMGMARRCSWLVVIAFFVATWLAGAYATRTLTINTDTGDMLASSLGFQQRAKQLNAAFPDAKDGLTIIVRAPLSDEADAFAADLARRLKNDPTNFRSVFSVEEDAFFRAHGLLYLDEATLEARLSRLTNAAGLIEALATAPHAATLFEQLAAYDAPARRSDLGAATLETVYEELSKVLEAARDGIYRPFSWNRIAEDADDATDSATNGAPLRFIQVIPEQDLARVEPARAAIDAMALEIASLRLDYAGRVDAYVTGGPALRGEELRSVVRGILISLALSVFFVSALLFIAFRSSFLTVLSLVGLAISIIFTTAFAAFAVGELNLVSTAFTVLLVGLGLDFAIHLLLHVEERRAAGQAMAEAIRGSVHEVGPALAIAAPTTALAFFSFLPTNFKGIADLGLIAGGGVLISFVVAITFLPAALATFPGLKARPSSGAVRTAFGAVNRIAAPVALLTLALAIYAAVRLVPDARLEADPMALRDPAAPSVVGFNLLFDSESEPPYVVTRLVDGQAAAQAAAVRARALGVVRDARTALDFIPEDQEAKLDLVYFAAGPLAFALAAEPTAPASPDIPAAARALRDAMRDDAEDPVRLRLAAALDALLDPDDTPAMALADRAIFAFWPHFKDRLSDQFNADAVTLDDLPPALLRRYISQDGAWRVDILPAEDMRDKAALSRFVKTVEADTPDISGALVQSLKAGEEVAKAMLTATGLALVVVTGVLVLLLRRISSVLFIMAPLLLAMILTVAAGVALGVPFNFANVIVLPLLLGIGVDSGIHLVMRQEQVAAGEGVYGTSTPRAVLVSALTTVASFGSMMLLAHRGLASLGAMLTIAMICTLLCMLVVLPGLMRLFGRRFTANGA